MQQPRTPTRSHSVANAAATAAATIPHANPPKGSRKPAVRVADRTRTLRGSAGDLGEENDAPSTAAGAPVELATADGNTDSPDGEAGAAAALSSAEPNPGDESTATAAPPSEAVTLA